MYKVIEKIGKKSEMVHTIMCEPFQKSYASMVLLLDFYRERDIDFTENDWRYYFIARRTFLRRKKRENGGYWVCHYCKTKIYKIQPRNCKTKNNNEYITVDHKIARSKGGDITDSKNMLECCYKCNQNKDNKDYEEFTLKNNHLNLNKMEYTEHKKFNLAKNK